MVKFVCVIGCVLLAVLAVLLLVGMAYLVLIALVGVAEAWDELKFLVEGRAEDGK